MRGVANLSGILLLNSFTFAAFQWIARCSSHLHPLYFHSEGIFRTGMVCGGISGISVFCPRLHSIKEMIFGYFPQPLCQTQFLILKTVNVFRRLKSPSSLTYLVSIQKWTS